MKKLLGDLFLRRRTSSRTVRATARRVGAVRGFLEELEDRLVLSPMITPIDSVNVPVGKTFQLALDGTDADAGTLTYRVVSNSNATAVSAEPTLASNRSLRLTVTGRDSTGSDFTGTLTFELFEDLAPNTTARIIQLVEDGFYDNLIFHRIADMNASATVTSIIVQGGDPNCSDNDPLTNCGSGGSTLGDFGDEFSTQLTFTGPGQLAMANSGKDTNDSQFFITAADARLGAGSNSLPPTHLNFNHTIFGQLTQGFDILQKLGGTPVDASNKPLVDAVITSASIVTDLEDAVLRVGNPSRQTGTSTVTVEVRNTVTGLVSTEAFTVNVVPDTDNGTAGGTAVNDRPILGPILPLASTIGEEIRFTLSGTDLESDALSFAVGGENNFASGSALENDTPNADLSINQTTREVTVRPFAAYSNALSLVTVALATGNNGTGVVGALGFTNLAGGTDTPPAAAGLTTSLAGDDNDVAFTARATGTAGNAIRVRYVVSGLNTPLSLTSAGNDITVNVATSSVGSATSTASDIVDLFSKLRLKVGVRDASHGLDASAFDSEVVSIDVGVNQAPSATPQTVNTVQSTDTPITLSGDDGDADVTQVLTFRVQSLPQDGTLTDSAGNPVVVGAALPSAMVTYRAADGFAGDDGFTFDVRDDGGTLGGGQDTDATPAAVDIAVGANHAPAANDQTVAVIQAVDAEIMLSGADGEPDLVQTLSFRLRSLPMHGRLVDSAGALVTAARLGMALSSSTLTYVPDPDFTGMDSFTFDVMDNGGTLGGGQDTDLTPATVTLDIDPGTRDRAVSLSGGTLVVRGDADDNDIDIELNATRDRVLVTRDDEDTQSFPIASVTRINITGGDGDDVITIDAAIEIPAQIAGGLGDDEITGGAGSDVINGGVGDDIIDGDDGDDVLIGGIGTDELNGGDGNDLLVGGRDDDELNGNEGDDLLRGQVGDDDMTGGDGADKMRGDRGDDSLDGEGDDDRIFGGFGNDTLMGGDGNDLLRGGPREFPLSGNLVADDDELDGGDGDDHLWGGIGDDLMNGGEGDDTLRAGLGDDDLDGEEGDDIVRAGAGNDTAVGGDDDDFVRGGRGADDVDGGDGDDRVGGTGGRDTITGGDGADTTRGGRGRDEFADNDPDDTRIGFNPRQDTEGEDLLADVIRTDRVPGAPEDVEPAPHQDGDIDYVALGFPANEPPTYGPHHPFDSTGTDANPGITPRPTGIYTTEQPDEDVIHNLEHGHIWISYDPAVVPAATVTQLENLVLALGQPRTTTLGQGQGIILTPRAANDNARPIALASWTRLLQLATFDEDTIRAFVERFRGRTSPEGFITP